MYEKYVLEIADAENADKSEFLSIEVSSEYVETIGAISSEEEKSVAEAESSTDSQYKSGYEKLPEDATMLDRLAYGGKVALIGMTTVFMVLVIIWALCALMGKVFGNVGKKEEKKASDSPAPQRDAAIPQSQASSPRQAVPAAAVDYSQIAVIASASIAAYRGEDTVKFNISSIRPCVNGAVALAPEVVAQIAASIACLEGKDTVDFTISSIRII